MENMESSPCPNASKLIIPNLCSIINEKLVEFMEKEKKVIEKPQSTFTKRIGNTTFKVRVHFAENTTDTLEDKLLHLLKITDAEETFMTNDTDDYAV